MTQVASTRCRRMDLALATYLDLENTVVGDLRLRNGQLQLTGSFAESVAQHLRTRLLWIRGEWFLDVRTGVPYFEEVLGKRRGPRAESFLRRAIISTPGVVGLVSFRLTQDARTRRGSLAFEVRLTDGQRLVFRDFLLEVP